MKRFLCVGDSYALIRHKLKTINTKYISLLAVVSLMCLYARAQRPVSSGPVLSGIVVDTIGHPIRGTTVALKGTSTKTMTNSQGQFTLQAAQSRGTLIVSFLGHETIEERFGDNNIGPFHFILVPNENMLEEVEVNTGYQTIPKERATGSFVVIDSSVLNRSVGTNILNRIDGVVSGLIINRGLSGGANNALLTIRGRSTIFGNPDPLIVVDGFPYDGPIEHINPNDVESITVLRDAAAASIWGTRSGNGVIVIKTKSGTRNGKITVAANATFSHAKMPNLYDKPQISPAAYVAQEEFLFSKGFYDATLNRGYAPVSTAVEIMAKMRSGEIGESEGDLLLDALKNHDVRDEMHRYLYRNETVSQQQVSISGGGRSNEFYLSAGYDNTQSARVSNGVERMTLDAKNTVYLLNDRLKVYGGITYTMTNDRSGTPYNPYSPYDRLMGEDGKALPVVQGLRMGYVDTAGNGQLLDWKYRPLEELAPDLKVKMQQTRLNFSGTFSLIEGLDASASYQYLQGITNSIRERGVDRYYTRNFINQFSYITNEGVKRPVPEGAIVTRNGRELQSETYRFQLSLNRTFVQNHTVNAILGFEANDYSYSTNGYTLYGYNTSTRISANAQIDPTFRYPYYHTTGSALIPTAPSESHTININQSYYGNASYIFKSRYSVSGSFRRDESNLFGVKSNQKGVPLWSIGVAWNVGRESYYNWAWLPSLKLRLTYGYNGNVDRSLSGYLTVRSVGLQNDLGKFYADILNPPNPSLRWEKVKTWNVGIDFGTQGNRISGSLDIYRKHGIDLIGNTPVAPQTGIIQFRGNSADTRTSGVDVILNSRNIDNEFKWSSQLLFSYSNETITTYKVKQSNNYNIVSSNYSNPLEGYPYYAVFSYRSAGLDESGMPQGYLAGEVSQNYSGITTATDPRELVFHGSAIPLYFGGLRNTLSYRGVELSVNLVYKFDYYFKRSNVFAGSTYGFEFADYEKRWQQPGDERHTRIPALTYPSNSARNTFFQHSDDVVERGDHIRLQDIRLSYSFTDDMVGRIGLSGLQVFAYANNLGIIWRKNRLGIDPDQWSADFKVPLNVSLGLNLRF